MNILVQHIRRVGLLAAALSLTALIAFHIPHAAAEPANLGSGATLASGGKLISPDGQYALIMQTDGNLVDYSWPRALWASNTANHSGAYLAMQSDGNLVVYAPGGVALWASNTAGHSGAYLVLQNDANMIIRGADGSVLWASGAVDTRLDAGQRLNPGWQFQSVDRNYTLVMQTDGNLVLYNRSGPVWATGTNKAGSEVEMQSDGNLVVYAPGHIATWATGTFHQNSALVAQTDGNFVLYAPGSVAVWATNTNTVKPAVPSNLPSTLTGCPTMQQGSSGACVLLLQQYLNGAGAGPSLTADGVFGPITRQAVVNYQTSRGLTVDGIAGPQTLQALANHKSPTSSPSTHNYPASFNPQAAAQWATQNALTSIPVPQSAAQFLESLVGYDSKEPCTAFVSWAIAHGGMPQDADWFPYWDSPSTQHSTFLYISSNTPVPAWYAANNFMSRFTNKGWGLQRLMYPGTNVYPIAVGDVVYYQWYGTPSNPHLAIVTSIVNGQVKVTDQGGVTLYPSSINRPLYINHSGNDLRQIYPNMKVYVLHWQ